MTSLFSHTRQLSSYPGGNLTVAYDFDYRQPLLLLYLLYTIPSFVAYHKCRQFLTKGAIASSYFNVIFTNDFYINVALFIIDFLFTRLPISGLFVNIPSYVPTGIPLTLIYFLSYYLIYANFYSITLICMNRMSSVVFPYSCNAFWQRFVGFAIVLIYILPLATTWQMLTYRPYFLPLYEKKSNYQLVYELTILTGYLLRNSTALCAASIVLSVICVIANILTIFKYKKTMQTVTNGTQSVFHKKRSRRTEIAMVMIALVVCFSLVLQAVLQALIMIYTNASKNIRSTCQDLRAFALDIAICIPPWILYYTTVYSHKTTISTSSVASGVQSKTQFQ